MLPFLTFFPSALRGGTRVARGSEALSTSPPHAQICATVERLEFDKELQWQREERRNARRTAASAHCASLSSTFGKIFHDHLV